VPPRLVLLLFTAIATGHRPALAADEGDPWLARDKLLHFGLSAGLAAGGYGAAAALSREPVVRLGIGAGVALGAGLAKEMYDRRGSGQASLRDLAWDGAGTVTGLVVSWLIDRYLL
jgi:putative lipoprotein